MSIATPLGPMLLLDGMLVPRAPTLTAMFNRKNVPLSLAGILYRIWSWTSSDLSIEGVPKLEAFAPNPGVGERGRSHKKYVYRSPPG